MRPEGETTVDNYYDFLDPHQFDCLVILVPNGRRTTSIVLRVLRNGEVRTILLVFFLFCLTKIMLRWSRARNVAAVLFGTVGQCLAQSSSKATVVTNRREMLWTVGILVFSVTSTATLSAVVYQKLMFEQLTEPIRTMADLAESDVTIYVAEFFYQIGSWYEMMP